MDCGSLYLPVEIVANIIRHLPTEDQKNIRLVSKDLSVITAPFLFESVYISARLKDRETFTTVSEHPVFSQLVKEVVFDSTNIAFTEGEDRFLANRASYTRFLDTQLGSSTGTKYSKASFRRGFKIFLDDFYEQSNLARYTGDDMTRITHYPQYSPPANFSSLIMEQKNHGDLVNYLPDDLVRLVCGLPRMPKVRRFKITDCRYLKNSECRKPIYRLWQNHDNSLSVSVKNEGVRGIDKVILNPRPWPNKHERAESMGCNRSWYRGFFVLTQAASMTNMATLASFTVERACAMSGLSQVVFSMSQRELYHTMNAFSNLTTIRLKIQTGTLHGNTWGEGMCRGDLAQILGAAKHLQILELRMNEVNINAVSFTKFIGTHTWPNLRDFTLATVILELDGNGFLKFFERHRTSLRSLWLEEVMVVTKEQAGAMWTEVAMEDIVRFAIGENEPSGSYWNETLMAMASDAVALTEITYFQNNRGPRTSGWVFHSCNPVTVFDFLRSGGQNRPVVPCQHRARKYWFDSRRKKHD
ncbi:hypothetical protein MMC29_001150 [Sticta canariensis]|nr:hypothetical protein [Sticta canariensis]